MTLSPEQIFVAFKKMEDQGGGFAAHLAAAWFHADSSNKTKIEATWPDLIKKYHEASTR